MKQIVISALLLVSTMYGEAHAQLLKGYGLKAGLTSSNELYDVKGIPNLHTERRVGFCIAAFAEWLNMPDVSILTQVEYAQRGAGWKFVILQPGPKGFEEVGSQVYYSRLDVLSVPILLRASLPLASLRPFILAGPRLDFILAYAPADRNPISVPYSLFRKTIFGGSVGVGLEFVDVLPVSVVLEFRYNHDFVNSYENPFFMVRKNAFDFWLGARW